MLSFLEAARVAAGRQLLAVLVIISVILLIGTQTKVFEQGGEVGTMYVSVLQFLPWAYLSSALGLILIKSQSVTCTAARLRHASHMLRPESGLKALVAQLGLGAGIFAIFVLKPAPESLLDVGHHLGCANVVSFVWGGVMSVGVAAFGASAHAAIRAIEPYERR